MVDNNTNVSEDIENFKEKVVGPVNVFMKIYTVIVVLVLIAQVYFNFLSGYSNFFNFIVLPLTLLILAAISMEDLYSRPFKSMKEWNEDELTGNREYEEVEEWADNEVEGEYEIVNDNWVFVKEDFDSSEYIRHLFIMFVLSVVTLLYALTAIPVTVEFFSSYSMFQLILLVIILFVSFITGSIMWENTDEILGDAELWREYESK